MFKTSVFYINKLFVSNKTNTIFSVEIYASNFNVKDVS